MNFVELQQRLRDEGYDPYLAYSGRHDDLLAEPAPNRRCQGAWNLLELPDGRFVVTTRDPNRPAWIPRDTAGVEPVEFETEDDACAYIRDRVTSVSQPGGVRQVSPGELPTAVTRWIKACGWWPPRSWLANPFVATQWDQSFRLARVGVVVELHLRDHLVPKVGDPTYTGRNLDDACRALMTELGDRSTRPPAGRPLGWPRVAFNASRASAESIDRLLTSSFDAIARAYQSERGGPLLAVIAEGVRLDLTKPSLTETLERAGYELSRFGDGTSARFHSRSSGDSYEVRERADAPRFRLGRASERSNEYRLILESDDLDTVHLELARIFVRFT